MEEDIKKCEKFINLSFLYGKLSFTKTQFYEYQKAIANVLSRLKQFEEENRTLKRANSIAEDISMEDITQVMNKAYEDFMKDFIPTSLVKEKIEKLYNVDNAEALENLITRYKQLEKENEKLNQLKEKHNVRINDLCALVDNFAYNSIPVSLVKEKIEEINKAYEDSKDENGESEYYYPDYTIRVLEELLEKRK